MKPAVHPLADTSFLKKLFKGIADPEGRAEGSKTTASAAIASVDWKPSFGDKQKPLYHMPLIWRQHVGKPQYRREYKLALSKLCELKVQVVRHRLTVAQVRVSGCVSGNTTLLYNM